MSRRTKFVRRTNPLHNRQNNSTFQSSQRLAKRHHFCQASPPQILSNSLHNNNFQPSPICVELAGKAHNCTRGNPPFLEIKLTQARQKVNWMKTPPSLPCKQAQITVSKRDRAQLPYLKSRKNSNYRTLNRIQPHQNESDTSKRENTLPPPRIHHLFAGCRKSRFRDVGLNSCAARTLPSCGRFELIQHSPASFPASHPTGDRHGRPKLPARTRPRDRHR